MEVLWWIPVAAMVVAVGACLYWRFVLYRLRTIQPGVLYQSAAMPNGALRRVVQRHQIATVIDLRDASEQPQRMASEKCLLGDLRVQYLHLPAEQIPRDDTIETFLETVSKPANQPVLVHCRHGEGRAVLFAALWRIEQLGVSPEQARLGCRLFTYSSSFGADKPKGRWLRSYRPRRQLQATPDPEPGRAG